MLRRAPTAISLTPDDLELYEQRKQQRLMQEQAERAGSQSTEASQTQATASSRGGKTKEQRIMGR
jgi:hypothetical protein